MNLSDFPVLLFSSLFLYLLGIILICRWIYGDAKARGINPWGWLALVVLVSPNFLGLILYLVLHRREKLKICEKCGAKNPASSQYCSRCGSQFAQFESFSKSTHSYGTLVFGIILMFLSLVGLLGSVFQLSDNGFHPSVRIGFLQTNYTNHWHCQFKSFTGIDSGKFNPQTENSKLIYSCKIEKGNIQFELYNDKDSLLQILPINKTDTLTGFQKGQKYRIKVIAGKAKGRFAFDME